MEIERAEDGNVEWPPALTGGQPFFTHKACSHLFSKAVPTRKLIGSDRSDLSSVAEVLPTDVRVRRGTGGGGLELNRPEASLYRGPELAEARAWWKRETPTVQWARRYHPGFDIAQRFLTKSVNGLRFRRGVLFGNIALFALAIVAIALLMAKNRADARRAEAAALEVRNTTASANSKLEEANKLFAQAIEAQQQGRSAQAAALLAQGQQAQQQAGNKTVLAPSELTELDRLRKQEGAWQRAEADLRQQLAARREAPAQAPPTATAAPRPTPAAIEQVLAEYRAAYEALDPGALARVWPTASRAELTQNLSRLKTYSVEILGSKIAITGDRATVTCVRRISSEPKVGTRQNPPPISTVFRLRRAGACWVIETVEEQR